MQRTLWAGALVGVASLLGHPAASLAQDGGTGGTPAPAAERSFGGDPAGLHLVVSDDGRRLAAMSAAGRFVVWDVASPKPLTSGDAGAVPTALAFVDSGRRLVASVGRGFGSDVRVAAFDCSSGKQVHEWTSRPGEDGNPMPRAARLAGVLPAENAVAIVWLGSDASLFSARTFEPLEGTSLAPGVGRFIPTCDGGRIVTEKGTAERSNGRWIWSVSNADAFAGREGAGIARGEPVTLVGLAEGASALLLRTAAGSPAGPRLVVCAYGLADGKPLWLLSDGDVVATASGATTNVVVARAGAYELLDARTGKTGRPLIAHGKTAAAAMSPDGAWVYALSDDAGTIRAIATGASPEATRPPADPDPSGVAAGRAPLPPARKVGSLASACAVSRDGRFLAVAAGWRVVLWSADSARPMHELDTGRAYVKTLLFTGGGTELLAGTSAFSDRRPEVLRWEVATGTKLAEFPSRAAAAVRPRLPNQREEPGDLGLVGSAGPHGILVGYADAGFCILDPASGRPVDRHGVADEDDDGGTAPPPLFPSEARSVAMSASGTRVAWLGLQSVHVSAWPDGRTVGSVSTNALPKAVADVHPMRVAFCGDADWVVCEGFRGGVRDREDVVFRIDPATAEVPWLMKAATLLDTSGGNRPEVLVATKNGVELIDATTGRSLRRLASAEGVRHARFIPGMRRAWIVSGKSGDVKAVNLPD